MKKKYCKLEVIDGHYPCFIEIKGAPFRIPVCIQANDLSGQQTMERREFVDFMIKACNNYESVKKQRDELRAALESIIRRQDIPSMFQLPNNSKEIIAARAALAECK